MTQLMTQLPKIPNKNKATKYYEEKLNNSCNNICDLWDEAKDKQLFVWELYKNLRNRNNLQDLILDLKLVNNDGEHIEHIKENLDSISEGPEQDMHLENLQKWIKYNKFLSENLNPPNKTIKSFLEILHGKFDEIGFTKQQDYKITDITGKEFVPGDDDDNIAQYYISLLPYYHNKNFESEDDSRGVYLFLDCKQRKILGPFSNKGVSLLKYNDDESIPSKIIRDKPTKKLLNHKQNIVNPLSSDDILEQYLEIDNEYQQLEPNSKKSNNAASPIIAINDENDYGSYKVKEDTAFIIHTTHSEILSTSHSSEGINGQYMGDNIIQIWPRITEKLYIEIMNKLETIQKFRKDLKRKQENDDNVSKLSQSFSQGAKLPILDDIILSYNKRDKSGSFHKYIKLLCILYKKIYTGESESDMLEIEDNNDFIFNAEYYEYVKLQDYVINVQKRLQREIIETRKFRLEKLRDYALAYKEYETLKNTYITTGILAKNTSSNITDREYKLHEMEKRDPPKIKILHDGEWQIFEENFIIKCIHKLSVELLEKQGEDVNETTLGLVKDIAFKQFITIINSNPFEYDIPSIYLQKINPYGIIGKIPIFSLYYDIELKEMVTILTNAIRKTDDGEYESSSKNYNSSIAIDLDDPGTKIFENTRNKKTEISKINKKNKKDKLPKRFILIYSTDGRKLHKIKNLIINNKNDINIKD
jgi:hypothetical protein